MGRRFKRTSRPADDDLARALSDSAGCPHARTYYARSAPSVKRLLTTREAAEFLGVSSRTVERLLAAGEVRGVKIRGCRRFDVRELDRYADALAPPPPPELLTEKQLRALHAKAGDLDRLLGAQRGESKRLVLEQTPGLVGRLVRSARELTIDEASVVLDALEARLEEHAEHSLS